MRSIITENHSVWPNAFVTKIVPWILEQVGINWQYKVRIYNHSSNYRGLGRRHEQISRINRNFNRGKFPYSWGDHRYQWAKSYELKSIVEVFIMLVAHEACHAKLLMEGKHEKRDFNEFRCDDCAFKVVEAYRAAKKNPERVRAAMRKERLWRKQKRQAKDYQKSPAYKLQLAQANLKMWLSKKKFAETKIRKYQKRVKYYTSKVEAV